MSNLPKKLQEIKDRCEKATPGPWHNLDIHGKPDKKIRCNSNEELHSGYDSPLREKLKACRGQVANTLSWNTSKVSEQHKEAIKNAEFIAHSRQDIPRLVKALEACMEQRRRMTYNELTEDERKMFFANKVLDSMDQELEAILEGK